MRAHNNFFSFFKHDNVSDIKRLLRNSIPLDSEPNESIGSNYKTVTYMPIRLGSYGIFVYQQSASS